MKYTIELADTYEHALNEICKRWHFKSISEALQKVIEKGLFDTRLDDIHDYHVNPSKGECNDGTDTE